MDLKKAFATNAEKENDGVWVDVGDGARVKIARQGNPDHVRYLGQLLKPHQTAMRLKRMPDDVWVEIGIKVAARTVLKGWEGVTEDGVQIPYTQENAERLLRTYRDFRDLVASYSNDLKLFQDEEEEAATGN